MKHLILDFDGVLANSFGILYEFNKYILNRIGITLSNTDYRSCFNGNFHLNIQKLIGNDALYQEYKKLRQDFFQKYYEKTKLFEGSSEFIKNISTDFKLAIASSTRAEYIKQILSENDLNINFDYIFGDNASTKENIMREIATNWNIPSDKIIFISDTRGDLVLGKNFGFKTIGVLWGYHTKSELKGSDPDFLASDFLELENWLKARS